MCFLKTGKIADRKFIICIWLEPGEHLIRMEKQKQGNFRGPAVFRIGGILWPDAEKISTEESMEWIEPEWSNAARNLKQIYSITVSNFISYCEVIATDFGKSWHAVSIVIHFPKFFHLLFRCSSKPNKVGGCLLLAAQCKHAQEFSVLLLFTYNLTRKLCTSMWRHAPLQTTVHSIAPSSCLPTYVPVLQDSLNPNNNDRAPSMWTLYWPCCLKN